MISGYCTREGAEDLKNSQPSDQNSMLAGSGSRAGQRSGGPPRTSCYDLVVMAASAAGMKALQAVLSALPADFPAPIAIVQHRSARVPNLLTQGLARPTPLVVKMAKPSETMQPGTVYLAPPDRHLTVHRGGAFGLSDGRKIRHVRSSANPQFESAAAVFGGRVIAVVLTGYDRDGTDGVQAVKGHGEMVIVQDEATSECFGMPRAAIETGFVDWVLSLEKIGPTLVDLMTNSETPTGD
jgi:two-component system, chemotaxis family, protein-glutamate methylesterase/glutaminase